MPGKLRNGDKWDKFVTASSLGRSPAVTCESVLSCPTNSRLTQGCESCPRHRGQGMIEHLQHLEVSDMSDSHPQQPCAQGSSQRQDSPRKGNFPMVLLPAPSTAWGSLPGLLPALLQGSTLMDVGCAEPQVPPSRWGQARGAALTPAVPAIVVGTALRDPLAGNAAPPAASSERPPGREGSPEGVPGRVWPRRPQQRVAVQQERVPQQVGPVIVAAPGFPLWASRQNTGFATLVTCLEFSCATHSVLWQSSRGFLTCAGAGHNGGPSGAHQKPAV